MSYFNSTKARLFGEIARCLLNSKSSLTSAVDFAEIAEVSNEVRRTLRSIGLLSELVNTPLYQSEALAFVETLPGSSALDDLAVLAHSVPIRRRIVALTTAISGEAPGEGSVKSVASFQIAGDQLAILKAAATVVESAEMAGTLGDAGTNFLLGLLRSALGPASDVAFFSLILSGVSPMSATGTSASAFRYDLATALQSLSLGQTSKPAVVVPPDQAIALACLENSDGSQAFPDFNVGGGVLCGVPAFVSSGVPADDGSPSTPQIVVLDGQALAIDPGTVVLSPSGEANVEIEEQTVSLFQSSLLALRAERWFGASLVRSGGVALVRGAYGPSETSP